VPLPRHAARARRTRALLQRRASLSICLAWTSESLAVDGIVLAALVFQRIASCLHHGQSYRRIGRICALFTMLRGASRNGEKWRHGSGVAARHGICCSGGGSCACMLPAVHREHRLHAFSVCSLATGCCLLRSFTLRAACARMALRSQNRQAALQSSATWQAAASNGWQQTSKLRAAPRDRRRDGQRRQNNQILRKAYGAAPHAHCLRASRRGVTNGGVSSSVWLLHMNEIVIMFTLLRHSNSARSLCVRAPNAPRCSGFAARLRHAHSLSQHLWRGRMWIHSDSVHLVDGRRSCWAVDVQRYQRYLALSA